jgi:hypothetical protein
MTTGKQKAAVVYAIDPGSDGCVGWSKERRVGKIGRERLRVWGYPITARLLCEVGRQKEKRGRMSLLTPCSDL